MKEGNFKSKQAMLILLCILVTISAVSVRAEEEYHVIATLEPPIPRGFGGFGGDIVLSEDFFLIGEWWANVGEVDDAGMVYLYDTDWNLKSALQAPEPESIGEFGRSVDILGDRIVVSHHLADVDAFHNSGEVYVFDSNGSLLLTLRSPEPHGSGKFGSEVALSEDIILVGETGVTIQGIHRAGRVHAYNTDGVHITTLTSPSMKQLARFGKTIAVSDEFILVGEYGDPGTNHPIEICTVHVFDFDWNHVTTLQSPGQGEHTFFGISMAVSGDTVVIGEIWATVDDKERAGRAYIFDTGWNHIATLQAPDPKVSGEFGRGVTIGGDLVVVGERRGDVSIGSEGKAYVFDMEGNLISTLTSPEPTVGAQFGWRVATDGEIVVVADVEATVEGVSKAGKVHVFAPGPGAEPEAEQEPISVQEEAKPEAEEEKPGFVIPGFPHASITLGLAIGAFVLWLLQRKH